MFERQTGVYIGSKIPHLQREAILAAVSNGNYLNSSAFIRDAIKRKLQLEGYILSLQSVRKTGVSNMMPGGHESIPFPERGRWTVTLWHFGTDSQNYKELVANKYCVTWQQGQNTLGRISNKRKYRKRREIQERLDKAFTDALKEKFDGGGI
jgi:Arc/MetJ-type ribon-helix-helix transcriptional regulator